MSENYKSKKYA